MEGISITFLSPECREHECRKYTIPSVIVTRNPDLVSSILGKVSSVFFQCFIPPFFLYLLHLSSVPCRTFLYTAHSFLPTHFSVRYLAHYYLPHHVTSGGFVNSTFILSSSKCIADTVLSLLYFLRLFNVPLLSSEAFTSNSIPFHPRYLTLPRLDHIPRMKETTIFVRFSSDVAVKSKCQLRDSLLHCLQCFTEVYLNSINFLHTENIIINLSQ